MLVGANLARAASRRRSRADPIPPSLLARLSSLSINRNRFMSPPPSTDSTLISTLPSKPSLIIPATPTSTSSLSRLPFALPAKPTIAPPPPLSHLPSTHPRGLHDERSPSPEYLGRGDLYAPSPSLSPRRRLSDDVYIPKASPPPSPPPFRQRADTYIPSPPRRRSPSFSPRQTSFTSRSRSLIRRTTLPSSRSRSPVKRTAHSPPRSTSIRSPSPAKSRSPPPKTFFTHGHRKAEESEARRKIREEQYQAQRKVWEEQQLIRREQKEEKQRLVDRRSDEQDQSAWAAYKEKRSADVAPYGSGPSSLSLKRPLSPTDAFTSLAKKPIPTGPRAYSDLASRPLTPSIRTLIPTGPRSTSTRPPPIGPRSLQTAAYSTAIFSQPNQPLPSSSFIPSRSSNNGRSPHRDSAPGSPTRLHENEKEADSEDDDTMTKGYRNRPRGAMQTKSLVKEYTLDGPPLTESAVMDMYRVNLFKPNQLHNPKAVLANHAGESPTYEIQQVNTRDGAPMVRAIIKVDSASGMITGIGDGFTGKDAEKTAALSAILQLSQVGSLGSKPHRGAESKSGKSDKSPSGSADTIKLTDGSVVSYERARQFMEYYCNKFKFGKPDIDLSQTSAKGGGGRRKAAQSSTWDAVMSVGGRRIGMGAAPNKKGAQQKCYLDVTQYLEECDPGLWKDFSAHAAKEDRGDIGMAPHLVFQLSDGLNDDIYGLCGDIKQSSLFKNAPPVGVTNEPVPVPSNAQGRRSYAASEEQLKLRSALLLDTLDNYNVDPKLAKMRAQRQSLPVYAHSSDVLARIEVNDVTIIMAATGSGKTTQVPQMLFDDYINRGEGAKCNILCTQPRRLAATSVAERIADERGEKLGQRVGYQVRFDSKLPQADGSITFCTTGIFLRRMQSALGVLADKETVARMDEISHIIIDEVHERDIDTDLSLVVLKRLLADRKKRGKPLKVVLMSATIDPTLFKNYFIDGRGRPAPVAEIPGRTFPVTRHHIDSFLPDLQKSAGRHSGKWVFDEKVVNEYLTKELRPDPQWFQPDSGMELEIPYPLVALTIGHVLKNSDDGHVLVFLPGWQEIKKVADLLLGRVARGGGPIMGINFNDASKYSIHYLHSAVPAAEQRAVFEPPPEGVRRIILATNIAETSVTIPDVVYVVDAGRVKEQRYDPARHMSSLVSAWVSKSNLNQRAGRAGRHREGEYYSLVSKMRHDSLLTHQAVEMHRVDLSNVVMHVKALNLGEVEDVLAATIEPPESSRITAAMEQLFMLGALDIHKNLTALGRVLLQIPIEANLGKLILYGSLFRCLDSALTLAAVLASRDPFVAPMALKQQSDEVKDSWTPQAFRSDPLAAVQAYNAWAELDDAARYSQANQFCSENFLMKASLLQIKLLKTHLLQALDQAGVIEVSAGGQAAPIARGRNVRVPAVLNENGNSLALLAALIAMASAPNFALRTGARTCRTAQDKSVIIHASSVNAKRRETGGPEEASESFNPAEKRLYAFGEKQRMVALGSNNSNSATTSLRSVTRLDPMTYMLFGAYELAVTQKGLECDSWLPVTGDLRALDDIQRLKTSLDQCILRVFEGIGKSILRSRDKRHTETRNSVVVAKSSSKIVDVHDAEADDNMSDADEGEGESDDEDDQPGRPGGAVPPVKNKRIAQPLSMEEVKELELLTTDVVRLLNAYASERESTSPESRVGSRSATPGPGHGGAMYAPRGVIQGGGRGAHSGAGRGREAARW